MPDISTKYMGLDLRSPVIIASGPLTSSLDGLKKAEDSGAGAVVLKSIFEEQIEEDASREALGNEQYHSHSDSHEYYAAMARDFYIDRYLTLLESAKKSLSIPVIASINCKSARTWVDYAERFSGCGADAIELNYFPIASNASVSGEKVDKALFEFAKVARSRISGKLSMKIGSFYSSLSSVIKKIDEIGMDALVLFNRPFRPDIDLKSLEVKGAQAISSDTEYGMSLRWTALMSAEVGLDIEPVVGLGEEFRELRGSVLPRGKLPVQGTVLENHLDGALGVVEEYEVVERVVDGGAYEGVCGHTPEQVVWYGASVEPFVEATESGPCGGVYGRQEG